MMYSENRIIDEQLKDWDNLTPKQLELLSRYYFSHLFALAKVIKKWRNLKVIFNTQQHFNFNLSMKRAKHWVGLQNPWQETVSGNKYVRLTDDIDLANKYYNWINSFDDAGTDFIAKLSFDEFIAWCEQSGFSFKTLGDHGFLKYYPGLAVKLSAVDSFLSFITGAKEKDYFLAERLYTLGRSKLEQITVNGCPVTELNSSFKNCQGVYFNNVICLIVVKNQVSGNSFIASIITPSPELYYALKSAALQNWIKITGYYLERKRPDEHLSWRR